MKKVIEKNWLIIGSSSLASNHIVSKLAKTDIKFYGLSSKPAKSSSDIFQNIYDFYRPESLFEKRFSKIIILSTYLPIQNKEKSEYDILTNQLFFIFSNIKFSDNGSRQIILFSSTDVVNKKEQRFSKRSSRDQRVLNYSEHKLIIEKFVRDFSLKEKLNCLILRLPALLYPGVKFNFFARILQKIKNKEDGTFYNPERKLVALIHLDDIIELISKPVEGVKTLVCGCDGDINYRELSNICVTLGLSSVKWETVPGSTNLFDVSGFSRHLGYIPSSGRSILKFLNESMHE